MCRASLRVAPHRYAPRRSASPSNSTAGPFGGRHPRACPAPGCRKVSPRASRRSAPLRVAAQRQASQLNGQPFGAGIPKPVADWLRDALCINRARPRRAPLRATAQRHATPRAALQRNVLAHSDAFAGIGMAGNSHSPRAASRRYASPGHATLRRAPRRNSTPRSLPPPSRAAGWLGNRLSNRAAAHRAASPCCATRRSVPLRCATLRNSTQRLSTFGGCP
jgi:hypothetical protein